MLLATAISFIWVFVIALLLRWFHVNGVIRDGQDMKMHREIEDEKRRKRIPYVDYRRTKSNVK